MRYVVTTLGVVAILALTYCGLISNTSALSTTVMVNIALAACAVLIRHATPIRKREKKQELGEAEVLHLASQLILLWLGAQMLAVGAYSLVGSANFDQHFTHEERSIVLVALTALVVAPVCEEILMRGLIYPLLRFKLSGLISGLLSSTLFALIHANIVQIIVAFALGLFLAAIYERTNTLWHVIAFHVLFNTLSLFIPASAVVDILGVAFVPAMTFAVILVAFTLSMVWFTTLNPKAKGSNRTQSGAGREAASERSEPQVLG